MYRFTFLCAAFLFAVPSEITPQNCSPGQCTGTGYNELCAAVDPNTPYCQEGTCSGNKTPIIIDTGGNGYTLTSAQNGVQFDLNGRGVAVTLSWTAAGSDDAFLALDRNGNGVIDNGLELFGNYTPQSPTLEPNGFLALAEFDKPAQGGDGDGWITPSDAVFPRLRLWNDFNHNGRSEPSELSTLSDRQIIALELHCRQSRWQDGYGNFFRYRAKVMDSKTGTVAKWAYDVFLVRSTQP